MEPAQALEPDPFDVTTAHAAGIDFEEVPDPPPDRTKEPPPDEEDGSANESDGNASPTSVTTREDTNGRRVPLSEWQRALRKAHDLTSTEHHVALAIAAHMRYRDETRPVVEAHCWPSPDTLAEEMHRSRSKVYAALAGLERKGWIFRERRPGGAASIVWATLPEGAEIIPFGVREVPPTGQRSPAHGTEKSRPRDTEEAREDGKEDGRAIPSLTDPELYRSMERLAEASGARSPKAWIPGVFASDLVPIIEKDGRDAGLAEIERRIASKARRRSSHHPPEQKGHGETVATQANW